MNEQNLWLIYDHNTGKLHGFYTAKEPVESIVSKDENLSFVEVTKEIHSWVFENKIWKITIDTEKMKEFPVDSILSEPDVFIVTEPPIVIDIEGDKSRFISKMKSECGHFITRGLEIELSDGSIKQFSYKTEDQINLKRIIDNNKPGDMIYYHADGEFDTYYSYEDIITIEKALYNNKLFNQIYTQVVCQWIIENYNEEISTNPDLSIEYGFSNDWIEKKMGDIYNEQQLL